MQKYKQTLTLNTKGPQLFQADWAGVDKLTFETYINDCTDKGRQFVMDNFKFVSGVPEPSTWALMIAGFGGVGVMIRDSLAANSMEIFMGMTGANEYRWDRRTSTGGGTTSSTGGTGIAFNRVAAVVGVTVTAASSDTGA